jgi:hypothetical protein
MTARYHVIFWGIVAFGVALIVYAVLGIANVLDLAAGEGAGLLVAGATLLLAAFTARLAVSTAASIEVEKETLRAVQKQAETAEKQVDATNKQAEVARQTLEASQRPMLVDLPPELADAYSHILVWPLSTPPEDLDKSAVQVQVPFRNIGAGPATLHKVMLSVAQLHHDGERPKRPIVPPREHATAAFTVKRKDGKSARLIDSLQTRRPFSVTIWYRDLGERVWRTRLEIAFDDDWGVVSEQINEENDD